MRPLAFAFAVVSAFSVACAKPEPPKLTPKQASVTGVSLAGVELRLQMDATNPNGFDLSTRSVTAKVVLDGKYDVGNVTAPSGVALPAGKTVTIDVPMSVKWTDMMQLVSLAGQNRPIPYSVDGTATFGGDKLNVDLPFHLDGTITQEQLKQAAAKSLPPGIKPGLLPGL